MTWTHAICINCWKLKNGERTPNVVKPEYAEEETCCFCGRKTKSGIYVREDPTKLICKGEHE